MPQGTSIGVVGISSRAAWNVIDLAYAAHYDVLLVANRNVPRSVGIAVYKSLGTLSDEDMIVPFFTGVVRPESKRLVASDAESYGLRFSEPLVSSAANVAYGVELGSAVTVAPMAAIGPYSRIENQVRVQAGVVIGHHSRVGAFSHVGDGATLAGGVTVGPDVFIGVGATIRDGVVIGAGATIQMGAVVTRDVEPGATVVGNPARVMK